MIIYCPHCHERYDMDELEQDTTFNCVVCKKQFIVEKTLSSLVACPDCGHMISKRAVLCPSCGYCQDYDKLKHPEVKIVAFRPDTSEILRVTFWVFTITLIFIFLVGLVCGLANIRIF